MAKTLEEAFDVPAEFFINLQRMYDLSRAKEPDPGIAKRAQFFQGSYPLREMVKRGWLEDAEPEFIETQMKRFFEVNSVKEIPHLPHAAKKTNYDDIPANQLVWLFRVRHIAKTIESRIYSRKKLIDNLPKLKGLMVAPEEIRHVPRILEECGIRYVIVETLPEAKIDGVCFWLHENAPVIGMTTRYDRIDNFWFVLAHEITHVIEKHGQDREIIDTELDKITELEDTVISLEERIANEAAADFCVPKDIMESFYVRKDPFFSERDILGLARRLQIHPGIVVGQLHNRTKNYRVFRKHLVKIREHLFPSALIDGWGEIIPTEL